MSGGYSVRSVDGKVLCIDPAVAELSGFLKSMFQDFPAAEGDDPVVDLIHEHCTAVVMEKVLAWMSKMRDMTVCNISVEEREKYNKEFFDNLSPDKTPSELLFHVIVVTNYLDIPNMLDLACKKMAEYVRSCQTPEELRTMFNVTGDFTPEEDEEARRKYGWCDNVLDAK